MRKPTDLSTGLTAENGSTFNMNGASLRNNGLYTAGLPGNVNLGRAAS